MVWFFNEKEPLLPALQYFGTQGFFHDYNARLAEPLRVGQLDSNALTRAVAAKSQAKSASRVSDAAWKPGPRFHPCSRHRRRLWKRRHRC